MTNQRIINIANLPIEKIGNAGRIEALMGRAGPLIGSSGIGCTSYEVPPGKCASLMHRHHIVHELVFVLQGEGETRLDERRLPIRSGDLIAALAGAEAHQIMNTGSGTLRYLAFSTASAADIIEYPDSGKLLVEAGIRGDEPGTIELLGRLTPAEYYEGEK